MSQPSANNAPSGYVITMADGQQFHCVIERMRARTTADGQAKYHWVFYDPDVRHVGPPWAPLKDVTELEQIVTTWWAVKQSDASASQ